MSNKRIHNVHSSSDKLVMIIMAILFAIAVLSAIVLAASAAAIDGQPTSEVWVHEIGWGGTAASSSDEWVELGVGGGILALDSVQMNFALVLTKTNTVTPTQPITSVVRLEMTSPYTFTTEPVLLFERTDDTVVSNVTAAGVQVGGLSNTGVEGYCLYRMTKNANGDWSWNSNDLYECETFTTQSWPAGSGAPMFQSMVRGDGYVTPYGWYSANMYTSGAKDANGHFILGTPGSSLPAYTASSGGCGGGSMFPPNYSYDVLVNVETGNLDVLLDVDVFYRDTVTGELLVTSSVSGGVVFNDTLNTWEGQNWTWRTDKTPTNQCIDSAEALRDHAEAILNGLPSSIMAGYDAEFDAWLDTIAGTQTPSYTIYLPFVTK